MKHFFSVYKALENKETAVDDIKGKEEAIKIISNAIEMYKQKFGK